MKQQQLINCIFVMNFVIAGVSCSRDEPADPSPNDAEVHFEYVGPASRSDGTNNGAAPFDVCALTGPGETVVLARARDDVEAHPWVPCDTQREFRDGYLSTSLEILRQAGPTVPDVMQPSIWFTINDIAVTDQTPAGTTFLASVRQAGDDWVVMAAVQIDQSQTAVVDPAEARSAWDRPIVLPHRWSDVAGDVVAPQTDYATACGDPGPYMGGARSMTDQEFDDYVHDSTIDDACVDGQLPSRDRDAGAVPNQNSDASE